MYNRDNPYHVKRRKQYTRYAFIILMVLPYIIRVYIYMYVYTFKRRTVGAQKFIRDLCALPVARGFVDLLSIRLD